jgi:thiosulfate dehydrogenase [quinone] large subunit
MEQNKKLYYSLGVARIMLGLIFLWAFFDKVFGLGLNTCTDPKTGKFLGILCKGAWLSGGSPTTGYLKGAVYGPLAGFYNTLAGSAILDWIFMVGLLGIGLTLTLGFMVRIGGVSGILMLLLMYSSTLPPPHHPFIDEHILYSVVILAVIFSNTEQKLGVGKKWQNMEIIKRFPFLA